MWFLKENYSFTKTNVPYPYDWYKIVRTVRTHVSQLKDWFIKMICSHCIEQRTYFFLCTFRDPSLRLLPPAQRCSEQLENYIQMLNRNINFSSLVINRDHCQQLSLELFFYYRQSPRQLLTVCFVDYPDKLGCCKYVFVFVFSILGAPQTKSLTSTVLGRRQKYQRQINI